MKTVLGIGGTDDSLRALEETLNRAAETGDELVVAVVENPDSPHEAEDVAQHVEEEVAAHEADAEVVRLEGHPGSVLVEYAEGEGFDEIVLGGGEKSAMGKIQMGHIAEFVLLNSHVSVKLVR
ncbi:MAG: universal stress protein [Halobacteriales archaeon]|nr:universal stress protein [Halobacteriales archaeon]